MRINADASESGVKPSGPLVSPDQRSVYPAASARLKCSSFSGRLMPVSGTVNPQR